MNWERASQRDKGWYYRGERAGLGSLGKKKAPYIKKFCKGTNAKGLPCRGAAQRGYDYCGPHLSQIIEGKIS